MGCTFLISHSFEMFETIILFSIFALVHPSDANIYEVAIFTDVTSAGFNHLTVHNDTGDVYVGGVNQLYRLNADLELKANSTTGPEYDDDEAYDTFNKILTINYAGDDELITCGGYQGVCQTRHIQGLTVIDSSPIFVVANKTNESTVGFVAPHYHLDQPMLYVGTTSTSTNPGSPLVSGRQLEGNQIFEVFGEYAGDPTRVDVASSYITTFPVGYVAGFSYGRYSYFLTTQKSSTSSSGYISKLVRVCQQAEFRYFNSYAEVTLRCLDDSYNLAQAAYLTRPGQDLTQSLALDDDEEVLFVTFAVGEDDPPTPITTSALCMYKMSVLETAFQDAAQGCMQGDGLQEFTAYWMHGATCSGSLPYSRGVHECYALTHYQYANGANDQYGHAVEDYPDTLVTSIAVTTVEQHTVGFLGTDTGSILKLHLVNTSFANTFEVVDFEESQSQFLPDMMFDVTEEHLYRLSVKSVRKIKVEDCSQYTTCASCLGSLDPYCGWCLLDKRCSTYASCADSQPSSSWLHHFDDDVCVGIEIESIDPEDSIPINVAHPITLNMAGLPDDDDSISYTCNYNGYSTVADRDGQSLTCDTPPPGYRPHILCDEDHITEILNVTDDTTNGDYSETDFHYYDCSVHKSCTSCVTSDWACNWCVYENRCTHYLDICQRDYSSSVVVGINNKFNDTGIKGQEFCPQLDVQKGEVLIPVNVNTKIQLPTLNIYDNKDLGEYECVLMVEGKPQTIEATRHNETLVTCNMRKYTYESFQPEMHVSLTLRWNYGYHVIDDMHGYEVTLYNCSVDRYDCTECLADDAASRALNCGWCKCNNTCEYVDHCESHCLERDPGQCCDTFNINWDLRGLSHRKAALDELLKFLIAHKDKFMDALDSYGNCEKDVMQLRWIN